MALFSDVDWIVILAVAAFLLFGSQGQQTVRQLGRWYGRMLRFKSELLNEVTRSAGLPPGTTPSSVSIRAALLGEIAAPAPASVPLPAPAAGADPLPPAPFGMPGILTQVQPVRLQAIETSVAGAAMGPGVWSVAATSVPGEVVRLS